RRRIIHFAFFMRMAMHEIENPMRSGTGPVDEIRPSDRTLRRDAGPQAAEPAGSAELGQMRQLSRAHHLFAQAGVHAVDADDNNLLAGRLRHTVTAASPARADARSGRRGRAL